MSSQLVQPAPATRVFFQFLTVTNRRSTGLERPERNVGAKLRHVHWSYPTRTPPPLKAPYAAKRIHSGAFQKRRHLATVP